METSDLQSMGTKVTNLLILCIFTFEFAIKVIAEGNTPWRYFNSTWNCFDFFIVFTSWLDRMLKINNEAVGQTIMVIRLFRIPKLFTHIPDLRVVVESLLTGMGSLMFVVIILMLFFYVFAILGLDFFRDNDPDHFENLQIALLSLFRAATCEDWTDIMYINMFGCKHYGYGDFPERCKHS